jgi:hypothetical protein
MNFDYFITDEQIRLKCLELASQGREGWSPDTPIIVAERYFQFVKEGYKKKEKPDEA